MTGAADKDELSACSRRMDQVDKAMLRFAMQWLPFPGGPIEDTLVEFGLTAVAFVERVRELVHRHSLEIHPDTARRLLEMCERRSADVDVLPWTAGISGT